MGMTRRQIHGLLLAIGAVWVVVAWLNLQMDWLNRSDLFLLGLVTVALGLHGLWKSDPR